jgi:hypothetical protein
VPWAPRRDHTRWSYGLHYSRTIILEPVATSSCTIFEGYSILEIGAAAARPALVAKPWRPIPHDIQRQLGWDCRLGRGW